MIGEQKCMQKVWKGTHAFISYTNLLRFSVARDFTDRFGNSAIYKARQEVFPAPMATAFTKSSPYIRKINKFYQLLNEAGLINKWMQEMLKYAKQFPAINVVDDLEKASVNRDAGPVIFSLDHLKAGFLLYLAMLCLSALVFICELVFRMCKII